MIHILCFWLPFELDPPYLPLSLSLFSVCLSLSLSLSLLQKIYIITIHFRKKHYILDVRRFFCRRLIQTPNFQIPVKWVISICPLIFVRPSISASVRLSFIIKIITTSPSKLLNGLSSNFQGMFPQTLSYASSHYFFYFASQM